MEFRLDGFRAVTWQQCVMYVVGIALIYLAIENKAEDLFTNHFIHCESTKNKLPIGTPLLF